MKSVMVIMIVFVIGFCPGFFFGMMSERYDIQYDVKTGGIKASVVLWKEDDRHDRVKKPLAFKRGNK